MPTGYGGEYRGVVVDDGDPLMQNRLRVLVPEIAGSDSAWAVASLQPGSVELPAIGDEVSVSYEQGDTDYPVWGTGIASAGSEQVTNGYVGKYRGIVVDNLDPLMQNRLQVSVPEVTDATEWARPGLYLDGDQQLPEVGAEVWIEFESGDPSYPVWVGVL